MKVIIDELDSCFFMEIEAESISDATQLARLAMGAKKREFDVSTNARRTGSMVSSIWIGKRQDATSVITAKGVRK